ncbi:hypothetical protein HYFRA_00006890 [Hymenoscyphus fraxineus]|uniref:Modin n=1 Tax=Hymenoscyphus fraxineus TaxID=746836 RepID=A0A9N9KRT0_9HELO|nr:hypothetical protein HYFRA_00006890 [Hymenoscyphus fraxineus]
MSELSVAVAALVVALVALVTAFGQLLQAYFATADGWRRCQSSVMGLWSKETKLRWRWAEFRFETYFMIPRIIYRTPIGLPKNGVIDGEVALTNSPANLDASMTLPGWEDEKARAYYNSDNGGNIVTDFIQHAGPRTTSVSLPTIQFIRKSWDFMPTDVVRPMASTTVSDIAIMARRLGMVWKKFDPGETMRAEGNGHIFTSSIARSLGIILQYSFTARTKNDNSFYIPVIQADKLGFGLVEFDPSLFGELDFDLDIGSFTGFAHSLTLLFSKHGNSWDRTEPMMFYVRSEMQNGDRSFIRGFNDLLPLCSRLLVLPCPTIGLMDRIPAPNTYHTGVTSSRAGFQVFTKKLQDLLFERGANVSPQLELILRYCLHLNSKEYDDLWHSGFLDGDAQTQKHKLQLRNLLIGYHTEMTAFLQESKVIYARLVIEHILSAALPAESDAPPASVNTGLWSEDLNWRHVASMEDYFKNLPGVARRVVKQHAYHLTETEAEDAWLAMIFRACCWQRSHCMILNVPPLPSEYWDSKMPVYIG